MKRIALLLLVTLGCATAPPAAPAHVFKSSGGPTYATVDLMESASSVAPTGITRLARKGGQLLQSTDGAAFTAIGGGSTGYAPPSWFDAAVIRLQAAVPTLNTCAGWKAGVNPNGVASLTACADAGLEGSWESSAAATACKLSIPTVWQALKNNPAGMSFRAKYPAVSVNLQQVGASNASHGMQLALLSSTDATKWFLRINGAAETDVLLSVADTSIHNFDLYYDPTVAGGTITVAIDGTVVGTTTTLTNLTADAQFPQIFSNNGGASGVAVEYAEWCWHE